MKYRIQIAARAEGDRDKAFLWYSQNYSQEYAVRWYLGISQAIRSLANQPTRCGHARENQAFDFELRQLLYGRSRMHRHRILFTVQQDTVFVLHIRHSAQDDVQPGELWQPISEDPK